MSLLALRPYQREAVDATHTGWRKGLRRPAVVLPTGAGKTVVFAHLINEWLADPANRGRRALVLAHRTELIEQAASKLHDVAPSLRVGIVKANRNETLADVVVASVATLRSESRRRQLLSVGLVVVDECHHATAASYLSVLDHYGCMAPGDMTGVPFAVAVGFTATMARGDKAALGDVWQDIVYSKTIHDMIPTYLVRPRGIRVRVDDLDLSKVKRSRGDYSEAQLGEALESSLAPEAIAKAYAEHAHDRPGILFAPTVSSASVMADALRDAGYTVALVHGLQPDAERRAALADFSAGRVQILANCMVLTEGTDLPLASCAVIARPTTNQALYVQMVGRVLRLFPGKADALVLDVVGASTRHALVSPLELYGEPLKVDDGSEDSDGAEADELDDDELTLDAGGFGEIPDYVDGPLVAEEVDLFHGSESAWLRTALGIWFIPAGDRYLAIVPGPAAGTYDVVAMHRYNVGQSRWVIRNVSELSYAMAWAEGDVTASEQMTARKERSWRARRPSPAQLNLAQRYGVFVGDDMKSGEVSNKITVAMATARIDIWVPAYAR